MANQGPFLSILKRDDGTFRGDVFATRVEANRQQLRLPYGEGDGRVMPLSLVWEVHAMLYVLRQARGYVNVATGDAYTVSDFDAACKLLAELDAILARIDREAHG